MITESYTETISSIVGVDEGLWINDYQKKDRLVIPEFNPQRKALFSVDFDNTIFNPAHYKLLRERIFATNPNPNCRLICERNDQLCAQATERYNQHIWPVLDLFYYKKWGLTYDMVMDIASHFPLKSGVVELFQDLQATGRIEVAINSYGMKPFIKKVLDCHGLSGIHLLANPIIDEAKGRLGLDLRSEEDGFDPYDIIQWPSEPISAEVNAYVHKYPVSPATKGIVMRELENELGVDPVNTVVAYDSGGDVNMARACRGLRIAQVNNKELFLKDHRLPALLKSTDIIALQPDDGFDIAAQAIRQRMMV